MLPKVDKPPFGPHQANLLLIAYAGSEGSGEPAHPRSLARTSATRSYKQWVKRNLQTESQIPGPSEWLGMRSYNLSWRNARRHKFAWRGPFGELTFNVCMWLIYFCINRVAATAMSYTVQPVYKDHTWTNVKLVFVHSWSLFGGSVSVTYNINSCQFMNWV